MMNKLSRSFYLFQFLPLSIPQCCFTGTRCRQDVCSIRRRSHARYHRTMGLKAKNSLTLPHIPSHNVRTQRRIKRRARRIDTGKSRAVPSRDNTPVGNYRQRPVIFHVTWSIGILPRMLKASRSRQRAAALNFQEIRNAYSMHTQIPCTYQISMTRVRSSLIPWPSSCTC